MARELIDITLVLHHQTPGAVLVSLDEEHPPVWLPKAAIEWEDTGKKTRTGKHRLITVTMPERLAVEKDLG